jgi:hypothetical protein
MRGMGCLVLDHESKTKFALHTVAIYLPRAKQAVLFFFF